MWTHFWDMHSGGRQKESAHHIFIEAPIAEAKVIFYNRFGHSADRVTCTCCGEDYSTTEYETLDEASEYQRRVYNRPGLRSLEDFLSSDEAMAIYAADIKPSERVGEVPEQGYVWAW